MPVIDARDNNWKPVKRYDWPAKYLAGDYNDALRAWRKDAIVEAVVRAAIAKA